MSQRARVLTERQAFKAMFVYLTTWFEQFAEESDDLKYLLSNMQFVEDDLPVDHALWDDWMQAVDTVVQDDFDLGSNPWRLEFRG